jgi:hypothetical protein
MKQRLKSLHTSSKLVFENLNNPSAQDAEALIERYETPDSKQA